MFANKQADRYYYRAAGISSSVRQSKAIIRNIRSKYPVQIKVFPFFELYTSEFVNLSSKIATILRIVGEKFATTRIHWKKNLMVAIRKITIIRILQLYRIDVYNIVK